MRIGCLKLQSLGNTCVKNALSLIFVWGGKRSWKLERIDRFLLWTRYIQNNPETFNADSSSRQAKSIWYISLFLAWSVRCIGGLFSKPGNLSGPKNNSSLWSACREKVLSQHVSDLRKDKITAKFQSLKRVGFEEKFRDVRETGPWPALPRSRVMPLFFGKMSVSLWGKAGWFTCCDPGLSGRDLGNPGWKILI